MATLKNLNLKNVNLKAAQGYKQKLKEFKTWAQIKSPKVIQPALSYTLGWLAPELLGSGFRMTEIADFEIKATVPADAGNLDSQKQLNQGLVVNAALELAKTFINRHLQENFYHISASEIKVSKKQKWDENLHLYLRTSEETMDDFFSNLQKKKKAQLDLSVRLQVGDSKTSDILELKLYCETANLLNSRV